MCGLGTTAGFSFTPTKTGNLHVWIAGMALNSTAVGSGTTISLASGTGVAPAAAAAATGTVRGTPQRFIASTIAGKQGFMICTRITGLALGTAVWFDLQVIAVTSGGASVQDVNIVIQEVP